MAIKTITVYSCDKCGEPVNDGEKALLLGFNPCVFVGPSDKKSMVPGVSHDQTVVCKWCVLGILGVEPSPAKQHPAPVGAGQDWVEEPCYRSDSHSGGRGPASGRPCTTDKEPAGVSASVRHGEGSWC